MSDNDHGRDHRASQQPGTPLRRRRASRDQRLQRHRQQRRAAASEPAAPPGRSTRRSSPRRSCRSALEASTVARRLIDYTRPLTSIDPRQAAFEPSTIALDRLVAAVVAEEQAAGPATVEWHTELAQVPPIQGHAVQLRAMLRHLIANAYDAMPGRTGSIALSTATDSRGWVVARAARRRPGNGRGDPDPRHRAVLQHQARPPRRRPEHRQRHLAPPSRNPVDPQPARRGDPRPTLCRAVAVVGFHITARGREAPPRK